MDLTNHLNMMCPFPHCCNINIMLRHYRRHWSLCLSHKSYFGQLLNCLYNHRLNSSYLFVHGFHSHLIWLGVGLFLFGLVIDYGNIS